MLWKYIYDDGPDKTLEETDAVTVDQAAKSYAESPTASLHLGIGSMAMRPYLKEGRGVIVFSGTGTDNDKPFETRITMTIRRNLLEIIEAVRPGGSSDPFAFRHMFRFTREQPPAVTGVRR